MNYDWKYSIMKHLDNQLLLGLTAYQNNHMINTSSNYYK